MLCACPDAAKEQFICLDYLLCLRGYHCHLGHHVLYCLLAGRVSPVRKTASSSSSLRRGTVSHSAVMTWNACGREAV